VLLVVTIRADGTPRLSPVEPFVLDGDLWLSMMLGSRKAADLVRDPRVLVHSIVTNRDGEEGEVKLRGTHASTWTRPCSGATRSPSAGEVRPGHEVVDLDDRRRGPGRQSRSERALARAARTVDPDQADAGP
jgi:hypothetical protein